MSRARDEQVLDDGWAARKPFLVWTAVCLQISFCPLLRDAFANETGPMFLVKSCDSTESRTRRYTVGMNDA